jgi:hypothetical protein
MRNGRCRLHGGMTPAAIASPHFKHGRYSKHAALLLTNVKRTRRCLANTRRGSRCQRCAMNNDQLQRCLAHRSVSAEALFEMMFGNERWFKKKWLKEPKGETSRRAKPLTEDQLAFLCQAMTEVQQADEQKEADGFFLFPFDLVDDITAETASEQE